MTAQKHYVVGAGFGAVRGAPVAVAPRVAGSFVAASPIGRWLREIEASLSNGLEVSQTIPEANVNPSVLWLEEVYSLVFRKDPDAAIDVLFDHVDELLGRGEYKRCDDLLKTIDPKRLDTNLLVAVLSVTKRASAYLPERQRFVGRVEARLKELAPGREARLLEGLR